MYACEAHNEVFLGFEDYNDKRTLVKNAVKKFGLDI